MCIYIYIYAYIPVCIRTHVAAPRRTGRPPPTRCPSFTINYHMNVLVSLSANCISNSPSDQAHSAMNVGENWIPSCPRIGCWSPWSLIIILIVNYPLLYPMGGCYIILLILHELSSKLSFTSSHGWMLYYTIDINTNDNNNNIATNLSLSLSLSLAQEHYTPELVLYNLMCVTCVYSCALFSCCCFCDIRTSRNPDSI